jgi:hypothetical protein
LEEKTIFSNCTDLITHFPTQQALQVISGSGDFGDHRSTAIISNYGTFLDPQYSSDGIVSPTPSKIKRTLCHVPTMLYNYFLSFDSDCLHKKMDVLSLKTTEETRIQSFKQNASSIMLLGLARDL